MLQFFTAQDAGKMFAIILFHLAFINPTSSDFVSPAGMKTDSHALVELENGKMYLLYYNEGETSHKKDYLIEDKKHQDLGRGNLIR